MKIKTYDLDYGKLHLIQTNLSKTCIMNVLLINKLNKNTAFFHPYLFDVLGPSGSKYNNKRKVAIRLEELYNTQLYSYTFNYGMVNQLYFTSNFVSNKYINNPKFLRDVISFNMEAIFKPNIKNNRFKERDLLVAKESIKRKIKKQIESPYDMHSKGMMNTMDKNSISSLNRFDSLDDVLKVNTKNLYEEYQKIMNTGELHIVLTGDIDFLEVYNIFKTLDIKKKNTPFKKDFYINNKIKKSPTIKEETAHFNQTHLGILYNIKNPTNLEKMVVFNVLSHILTGDLSSRLYKEIREKNSLCYGIYSDYMLFGNLFKITSSLDYNNVEKATSLIEEELEKIKKGSITREEVKKTISFLKKQYEGMDEHNYSITSDYISNKILGLPSAKDIIRSLNLVVKEDVIKAANKLILNTIYVLKEEKNEEN